jgi:WXG100 family type VII secretion target
MPDSTFTSVSFAALEAGEQAFQRSYAQLTETISTLESQLNTNLALWAGNAQTAYHQAQAVWKNAEANMAAVMQQLGVVTGTANANYQATESANAQMWG